MPKVIDTRKQRARKLVKRLEEGPSFSHPFGSIGTMHPKEASEQYKIWASTWIIPELKQLIPELRAKKASELRPTE